MFEERTFLETKPNFPLTGKCFSLTNFSNDKQTQESLETPPNYVTSFQNIQLTWIQDLCVR